MSNKRDWKAIAIDWTALDDYDNDEILAICLTQRQVAVLKACLMPAYWQTRWENLTATADELDEFVAEIDNQLSGNDCGECDMEFRDNPNDVCEVQYSTDGGDTWTTMFRKDVCPATPVTTTIDITNMYTNINTVTTNNTTWNNNIINVAPDWAYVDSDSDKALCWVIDAYVDMICDFAIEQIEANNQNRREEADWLDDIDVLITSTVMTAVMVTAGVVTLPVIVVGAITYATTKIVEGVWDLLVSDSVADFQDDDARDTVKCWMWNQIRGETPQFTTWSTSLDNFDYGGATTAEQSIASSTALFNAEADIYINWMILFEDINSISAGLPDCDCPQTFIFNQLAGPTGAELYGTEWTQPIDLAFSNPGDTPAVCPGVWNSGTEFYTHVASSIGGVGCNIRVTLPIDRLVSKVKVLWAAQRISGGSGGDKNAAIWLGTPHGSGTYIGGKSWATGAPEQRVTTIVENVAGFTPTPETYLYIHNSMDRAAGTARIEWVEVTTIPYVP